MKQYRVMIAGIEHVVQLSDADAKARGLTASDEVKAKAAPAPKNKARTTANKG